MDQCHTIIAGTNQCAVPDGILSLRERWYNAAVVSRRLIHKRLLILQVVPDSGLWRFDAGQYTTLGLGNWEPRVDKTDHNWPVSDTTRRHPLVRRAYSISCAMLDDRGHLQACSQATTLEFYVALVTRSTDEPPMLTPRLFALQEGDRLFVGHKARGNYTLDGVLPGDNVIFVATGTGEAPHNAMIAELLSRGHRGQIVSIVCVRYDRDLGYLKVHRALEQQYANFRYFPLTTREPRNVDRSRPDFVGKHYVQDLFESEMFDRYFGREFTPERTQVYLCGNPAMIGSRQPGSEVLRNRGFRLDEPLHRGNVHYEKYW
jgi:ferredoxin/flavodoxin---NADP+ reductase